MWLWMVLWQACTLLVVGTTLDFKFFSQKRNVASSSQANCFEYSLPAARMGRSLVTGWRHQKKAFTHAFPAPTLPTFVTYPTFSTDPLLNLNEIARRIDKFLPATNDMVEDYAKLVQDINGLRQFVWVAPIAEENRDYDDSVFQEIIETSTTTTPIPTTARPIRTTEAHTIPVLLLGGASSQRQVLKSEPMKFPMPTIRIVSASVSPLSKHPYPFVMQANTRKPIKVCMTSMPMYTTTRRPSLWQIILNSIFPR